MIQRLVLWRLATIERTLDESLGWLAFLARASLRAFVRFYAFLPMTRFRRRLPRDAYHVARIVVVRAEDCGTCLQTIVSLAKSDGVRAETLRAVLARSPEALCDDCADAYRFAEAVTANKDPTDLRERIRTRHGDDGLVELALAIAAARVIPTTKRALGYATSCAVRIDV
jgi:alkylhydroperoxidase family enzyme